MTVVYSVIFLTGTTGIPYVLQHFIINLVMLYLAEKYLAYL